MIPMTLGQEERLERSYITAETRAGEPEGIKDRLISGFANRQQID